VIFSNRMETIGLITARLSAWENVTRTE